MVDAGYAVMGVIPSAKDFQSKLSKQTDAAFTKAGLDGGRKMGDAASTSAASRLKGKLKDTLKEAFAPVAAIAAGAGVVEFFKGAIEQASDLHEAGTALVQVFGKEGLPAVQAFAAKGAAALGQSKLDVEKAAQTFGVYGKAAGLAGQANAKFSTQLVQLTTDLASFYNTSPEQAVEAVAAGLRGESEPLRQYGVLLNQATIQQQAFKMGLIASTKQALTPQQKVLASQAVIMKQTKVAQGDFARTSGGLANQTRELTAEFKDMQAEVGAKLLPVLTGTVKVVNGQVIPAVEGAGGVVTDAAKAFGNLPGPVKAAAGAFAALRLASALGFTTTAAAGMRRLSGSLDTVRIRAMLAADEYRALRAASITTTATATTFSSGMGRAAASLGALRVGAQGAGTALKAGLSGALGLVGGPWGAAFIAGTAIVTHFWQEHEKAKQYVDSLTDALDQQTGAVTKNAREMVAKNLQDSGALDDARKLGINLSTVTDAALGQRDALRQLIPELESIKTKSAAAAQETGQSAYQKEADAAQHLIDVIGDQNGAVADSRDRWRNLHDAIDDNANSTQKATDENRKASDSFQTLADKLATARDRVKDLMDAENKRRDANLANRRDRLALIEQMQATAEEATNASDVSDIRKQIREAQQQGAQERADLRQQLSQGGGDTGRAVADLRRQLTQAQADVKSAKGAKERAAALEKVRSIERDIADKQRGQSRDAADINQQLSQSYHDEQSRVAELRKELNEYTRTLNANKKAGQENLSSLYDLANQWNNSTKAVRESDEAYIKVRKSFISSAEAMGASSDKAKKLADQLLRVPKDLRSKYRTEGLDEAIKKLEQIKKLQDQIRETQLKFISTGSGQAGKAGMRFASGGEIGGYGTGTSDSNLIWASRGEFMQPKASVDYYGRAFMEMIRRRRFPRFAGGGEVGGTRVATTPMTTAPLFGDVTIVAESPKRFEDWALQHAQTRASGVLAP